ncbi:MAG: hypothetical protein HON65_17095 [Rhodospirillales bacterium]|jgi:methionyl-tRNA formyltransferase|nr:hypothetical protein [Rhodospirillales bacterium]
MLENVVLLGADNNRTRAYLSMLHRDGIAPSSLLLLSNNGPSSPQKKISTELFDNVTPAVEIALSAGITVIELKVDTINDDIVKSTLNNLDQEIVIFSGYGGAIINDSLFSTGKQFLHIHPGKLPEFPGSTTIYYSLLAENKIWASAILMTKEIDGGPVVGVRCFDPPKDRKQIDMIYDPYIRASLLCDVMADYAEDGKFEKEIQSQNIEDHYFIIHPVLKHAAILSQGIQK